MLTACNWSLVFTDFGGWGNDLYLPQFWNLVCGRVTKVPFFRVTWVSISPVGEGSVTVEGHWVHCIVSIQPRIEGQDTETASEK